MHVVELVRNGRPIRPLLALLAIVVASVTAPLAPADAQTSIKFSLDGRLEGLASTLLVPPDKGYFKA